MTPTVAIAVLTNRSLEPELRAALEHLVQLHASLEVVIVHSGVNTIPAPASTRPPPSRFRELAEPAPGLLAGRHRSVRETTAEILVFLDDDVKLGAGWFPAMLEPFRDPDIQLAGCRYLPDYECAPPPWLDALWTTDSHGRHLAALSLLDAGTETRPMDPLYIWGLCYAIRRTALERVGGFHPDGYPWELRRFRGDGEAAPSQRANELKLCAIYQGHAEVYHRVSRSRMTPEYFERRAYLQGISDSYTAIRRAGGAPQPAPLWKRAGRALKRTASSFRHRLAGEPVALAERTARAYHAGYRYHQDAASRDPLLAGWILRPDYWDYRLPS